MALIFTFFLLQEVQMADGLRASGKIYVLVLGVVLLWAGFVYYLVRLEKRIRKLEHSPDKEPKTKK